MRKVNQATSASCKAIASLAISAFTSSSCVCFAFSAGIALTTKTVPPILSEDGEGLGNRACNVFHFRTSVIQVLKKLKSRDSNRALFRNFFITLKKVVLIECFDSCYTKTSFNIRNRKLLLIISTITITAGSKRKQNGCLPLNSGKHP